MSSTSPGVHARSGALQKRALFPGWLIVLLALIGGCAAPGYKAIQDQPGDLPDQAAVEDVPFYPQKDYYCGPASLAMMLNWAGFPASQQDIAKQVYTPGRQGTLPTDILAGARRNGALAVQVASLRDLLAEIAAGHPVLVFQNLGFQLWPQWHFAVAFEYDLSRDQLVLHSGTQARRVTNLNAFERTWRRGNYWAITVTRPDELPARAPVHEVLAGATGLERSNRLAAAATAYSTISQRWPENLAARMGLGNVAYAQKDYPAAVKSYEAVLERDSEYAPAWNNLAYALVALDRREDAIRAAEKAVTISKGKNTNYRNTLEEIRGKAPAG